MSATAAATGFLVGLAKKLFQNRPERALLMLASTLGLLMVTAVLAGWRRPSDVVVNFLDFVGASTINGITPRHQVDSLHSYLASGRQLGIFLVLLTIIAVTYGTSVWLTSRYDRDLVSLSRESLADDPDGKSWPAEYDEFTKVRHGRIIRCAAVWTIFSALAAEVLGFAKLGEGTLERLVGMLTFLGVVVALLLATTLVARLARGAGSSYRGVFWSWLGLGAQVMVFQVLFTFAVIGGLPLLLYWKLTGPMKSLGREASPTPSGGA